MPETKDTFSRLEEEVRQAFSRLGAEDVKIATLLSRMSLSPLETMLMNDCKTWYGDGRVKYHPISVMKAFILKELKGIRSNAQLIGHLRRHDDERRLIGFSDAYKTPCQQMLSTTANERMTPEIREVINFIVDRIRVVAREEGRLLDIDFIPERGNGKKKSKSTIDRAKSEEGGRTIRFLREEVFPTINLPLGTKARYGKDNFLDLLAYVAYNNTFANQGYQLMREEGRFRRVPHGTTMLGYLRKLSQEEILDMYIAAFDRVFRIAKGRGLMEGQVDLAIDFHDWLYYGDKTDKMVVGGEPKNGTTNRFRFITIKIAEKHGDFTLLALPVGVFTNQRDAVKTLIEFAKERVRPRYFYIDRGFYSAKFISLFEELGIKYLMPGVKTKRVLRVMENHPAPAVVTVNMRSSDGRYQTRTSIAVKKDDDGKDVCFATNLPPLLLYSANLFELYGKRWNIETGYRVKKHEFRPNTTSKNHKIRLFYFMFSVLLYNLWVIMNAILSKYLFGEVVNRRLITAKMFMKKFYEAYTMYSP